MGWDNWTYFVYYVLAVPFIFIQDDHMCIVLDSKQLMITTAGQIIINSNIEYNVQVTSSVDILSSNIQI